MISLVYLRGNHKHKKVKSYLQWNKKNSVTAANIFAMFFHAYTTDSGKSTLFFWDITIYRRKIVITVYSPYKSPLIWVASTMDYSFLAARLSFTFIYKCMFFSWQINSAAASPSLAGTKSTHFWHSGQKLLA